jgi:potassium-transporting ATPase KdpC subunit
MVRTALVMLLLLTAITGIVYPLVMTGVARGLFPAEAGGSLIVDRGRIVGSNLLGQQFDDPRYFWSRPSATGPAPYNTASSSGSNYGPLNPDLRKSIDARRQLLQRADPQNTADIPIDLLTYSASGIDPHISPAAAEYQAARIARLRSLDISTVHGLIASHTTGRQWGFLGEPAVNVVALNRALDAK